MEAASNDKEWKAWFDEHGPRLLLCARQWTRTLADAEDVVQEAFVRFWNHQRQLGGNPRALLLTSIRRSATDLVRRDSRRQRREQLSAGDAEPWFEIPLPEDERTRQLEQALRQLPEEQREVLVLRIWGELSFEELGSQLGISVNTAASRYRYALSALRKLLNPELAQR